MEAEIEIGDCLLVNLHLCDLLLANLSSLYPVTAAVSAQSNGMTTVCVELGTFGAVRASVLICLVSML